MQRVVKFSFFTVCLLLTLHSSRSASEENSRQQVSTNTPELWTALGCFVNENDITICSHRAGKKKKGDEDDDDDDDVKISDNSEDDGPGFFEAISEFMNDGVKFFEGESYKDKEGGADAIEDDNDEDAEDKLNKKGQNDDDDDDYDDDDDDYDADEKGDDDDYDDDKDDDDYDDDRDEYDDDDDDGYNIVDTSNRTSISVRRRRRDTGSQKQGEESKRRKKKKSSGLMKLMMLGMLLKSKLSTFLMIFGTFLQLKFFGIAVLNLVVGLVRLVIELSKKKESQKIVYYEQAHHEHEHMYDQKHEEDKGWLSGWLSKQDQSDPQVLAYNAYAKSA